MNLIHELCTCSNTYRKHEDLIKNPYPENPESTVALIYLISEIIQPTINKFGLENFKLTYGFCSKDLLRFLKREGSRICPEVDQHLAYEINNRGNYYCKHQGSACDFQVVGIDSRKVIDYLKTLNYDSIYYYGSDKPVHVSWAEAPRRKIWEFTASNTPRPYSNFQAF
ncbi:hypothetical protein GNE10_10625 [Nostoc sp. 2RC]|nr:hypothetical protein [Nostoc sp. 2RC]